MEIEVEIRRNEHTTPVGKLADAEVHFTSGVLAGLKLVGFGVWTRRDGPGFVKARHEVQRHLAPAA